MDMVFYTNLRSCSHQRKNEQIMLSPTNLYAYSQLSRGINLQTRSTAHSNPTDPIILQTMKPVALQTPNSIDPQLYMKAKQRRPQHVPAFQAKQSESKQRKRKQNKAKQQTITIPAHSCLRWRDLLLRLSRGRLWGHDIHPDFRWLMLFH